jgi:hypothetical protein
MRKTLILFFLAFAWTLNAQEMATLKRLKTDRKHRKLTASENIFLLQNGVLLVRLDQQQRRIEYYTKYNNLKEAEKVRQKMLTENRAIIDAFRTYYTFSPLYFIAMEDTRTLLEKGMSAVTFYNDSALADPSIRPPDLDFFVAEFGFVSQDTTMYISGKAPDPSNESNPEGVRYYGGSKNTKPALVIYDNSMEQLRDPFPYYFGYSHFGRVKKRYRNPVLRWQQQLTKYLEKTVRKAD